MKGWVGRRLADRALVLGVLGGLLTSMSGVVGYMAVPFFTREYSDGLNVTVSVLTYFATSSLFHHGVVLLVSPFVVTLSVVLLARRWHLEGWETDVKIVSGIFFLPGFTVFATMAVALLAIGVTNHPVYVVWALVFGLAITALIAVLVSGVMSVGIACGYLLARDIGRRAAVH